ncbi:MAG: (2Fe-2S)-binding protein [Candidatus Tectomicrobia bacterium]|uniref:(2Fe-2S)-binding protein n=1 Tax=Tectimicrobiota bacterium TaxID=2528274 RepID=A0A932I3I2_UNCTE|nr:(2Fe-2S)-binding protein [Candidatus Tectomicrobia bacterium]
MPKAERRTISFTLNGEPVEIVVPVHRYLVDVIREDLGMMGTKRACDQGVCGSCSIIMNGLLTSACLTLAVRADGASIETIEGLGSLEAGLHPIQQSFAAHGATQCGYCTPGMIMSAKALLDENPDPTVEEIKHWLTGNLCRCTGYAKIIEAVRAAAEGRTEPAVPISVPTVKAIED